VPYSLNPPASVGFFLHVNGDDDDEDEGAGRWVVYNTALNRRRSLPQSLHLASRNLGGEGANTQSGIVSRVVSGATVITQLYVDQAPRDTIRRTVATPGERKQHAI